MCYYVMRTDHRRTVTPEINLVSMSVWNRQNRGHIATKTKLTGHSLLNL